MRGGEIGKGKWTRGGKAKVWERMRGDDGERE